MNVPNEGILAALWIPTDADGRLIRSALESHLAWLRSCGVAGVLALGSTGEFPRFSVAEREKLLATIAELAAPMPVIANISDLNFRNVARLGAFARTLGLPAVAVMPPSFYPVSADDQLAFFLRAAEASDLPVFLYNFPELTGNRIDADTVTAFASRARMAGIKQSGAEFGYLETLVAIGREKGFAVFSGADTRLPEAFKLGVAGCIGGLVNIVPESMVHIHRVCREDAGGSIHPAAERLRDVGATLDKLTFPLNVAAGLEARGFDPGAPKCVVSDESSVKYREIVRDLRGLFSGWGLPAGGPVG